MREKECSVARKEQRKKRVEKEEERAEIYTRAIIMLPMPRARAVCLEL